MTIILNRIFDYLYIHPTNQPGQPYVSQKQSQISIGNINYSCHMKCSCPAAYKDQPLITSLSLSNDDLNYIVFSACELYARFIFPFDCYSQFSIHVLFVETNIEIFLESFWFWLVTSKQLSTVSRINNHTLDLLRNNLWRYPSCPRVCRILTDRSQPLCNWCKRNGRRTPWVVALGGRQWQAPDGCQWRQPMTTT